MAGSGQRSVNESCGGYKAKKNHATVEVKTNLAHHRLIHGDTVTGYPLADYKPTDAGRYGK